MMVSRILKISALISVAATLSGCAHMDEAASHVQVVNGNNAFTSQCKMLGPVSDEQSEWSFATPGAFSLLKEMIYCGFRKCCVKNRL